MKQFDIVLTPYEEDAVVAKVNILKEFTFDDEKYFIHHLVYWDGKVEIDKSRYSCSHESGGRVYLGGTKENKATVETIALRIMQNAQNNGTLRNIIEQCKIDCAKIKHEVSHQKLVGFVASGKETPKRFSFDARLNISCPGCQGVMTADFSDNYYMEYVEIGKEHDANVYFFCDPCNNGYNLPATLRSIKVEVEYNLDNLKED